MVNDLLAQEFKKVVQEELNIELSDTDAQRVLSDLVSYFDLLAAISRRDMTDAASS